MEWHEFKVGQILGHKNAIGATYRIISVNGRSVKWRTCRTDIEGYVLFTKGWYIIKQAPNQIFNPAEKFKHHKDRVENRHLKRPTMR